MTLLPEHLNPGGLAVVLCAWLQTSSDSWEERISRWLPAGHDVWVGLRELIDVDTYIQVWAEDAGRGADAGLLRSWREAMARFDATEVAFGWIALAPTHQDPVVRVEDVRSAVATPTGEQLLERMAAAKSADELTATQILAGRFAAAEGQPWRGEVTLDPLLFALRERCDGAADVAEAVSDMSADLHIDEGDLLVHALAGVKALADLGLLVRVA